VSPYDYLELTTPQAWVLYTARAQIKLATVQSGTVHALHDQNFTP
jgi:hypothetical protein